MRVKDSAIESIRGLTTGEGRRALDHIMDGRYRVLFINGSAGSGKTDLLVYGYIGLCLKGHKVCCIASTGIAARNISVRFGENMVKISSRIGKRSIAASELLKGVPFPDAETIHRRLAVPAEDYFTDDRFMRPDELTVPLKNLDNYRKKVRKAIRELSSNDVLFIDESGMVSANLMDIIMNRIAMADCLREKEGRKPIRLVMFGDLHQLKPVIPDPYREIVQTYSDGSRKTYTIRELYALKYNGCEYFFGCDALSRRYMEKGKRFSLNHLIELKENHRINCNSGTRKHNEKNKEFLRHLHVIRDARRILDEAGELAGQEKIDKLRPLDDAVVFINSRRQSFSDFVRRKPVISMLKRGDLEDSDIAVLTGTNRKRDIANERMAREYRRYRAVVHVPMGEDNQIFEARLMRIVHDASESGFAEVGEEEREWYFSRRKRNPELRLCKGMKVVVTRNQVIPDGCFYPAPPVYGRKLVNGQCGYVVGFLRYIDKHDYEEICPLVRFNGSGGMNDIYVTVLPTERTNSVSQRKKAFGEEVSRICGLLGTDEGGLSHFDGVTTIMVSGEKATVISRCNDASAVYGDSSSGIYTIYGGKLYRLFRSGKYKEKSIPLEPSYALTFHKAQGQGYGCLYIHTALSDIFEGNSLYLALSRGKDISRLWISRKLPRPLTGSGDDRHSSLSGIRRLRRIFFGRESDGTEKTDYASMDAFLQEVRSENHAGKYPYWRLLV